MNWERAAPASPKTTRNPNTNLLKEDNNKYMQLECESQGFSHSQMLCRVYFITAEEAGQWQNKTKDKTNRRAKHKDLNMVLTAVFLGSLVFTAFNDRKPF